MDTNISTRDNKNSRDEIIGLEQHQKNSTPTKTYIEPENGPLEEKIPNLETLIFSVIVFFFFFFGGAVYIAHEELNSFKIGFTFL